MYNYLANFLLLTSKEELMKTMKEEEAIVELISGTIVKYPEGGLNEMLINKYDL